MARDADDIMYLISKHRNLVQKVQLLTDTTLTSSSNSRKKKESKQYR